MSQSTKKWGDTTSRKGEVSRVFVGNLDPKITECFDLERKFEKYGKILGIDIHNNGFAFVQFDNIEDAQNAVKSENLSTLKGKTIDVKMFGKSGPKKNKRERSRSPIRKGKPLRSGPKPLQNRRFFSPSRNNLQTQVQSLPGLDPKLSIFSETNSFNNTNNQIPNKTVSTIDNKPTTSSSTTQLQGNEIEIIVMSKDQWAYGELLEKKLRAETCLKFIDLLFPHSPQHIQMTLNDLYEKKTLYAIVVDALNEQSNTFTLHILHNQTEHQNITISEGINLICQDFIRYIAAPENSFYRQKNQSFNLNNDKNSQLKSFESRNDYSSFKNETLVNQEKFLTLQQNKQNSDFSNNYNYNNNKTLNFSSTSLNMNNDNRNLPNNIAYVLKTTLEDNTAKFLSISQIDSVVEYYLSEKDRLLSRNLKPDIPPISSKHSLIENDFFNNSQRDLLRNENHLDTDARQQSLNSNSMTANNSTLFENPQVKAALNSLLQMGALNPSSQNSSMQSNHLLNTNSFNNNLNDLSSNSNSYVSSSLGYSSLNVNDNKVLNTSQLSKYNVNENISSYTNNVNNTFLENNLNRDSMHNRQNYYGNNDTSNSSYRQAAKNNDFRLPRQSRFSS